MINNGFAFWMKLTTTLGFESSHQDTFILWFFIIKIPIQTPPAPKPLIHAQYKFFPKFSWVFDKFMYSEVGRKQPRGE